MREMRRGSIQKTRKKGVWVVYCYCVCRKWECLMALGCEDQIRFDDVRSGPSHGMS